MNSKITLSKFARLLSEKCGEDPKVCEDLLKALFRNVGDALESGENVKVKGFGTFKISKISPRKSVDVSSGEDTEIPAHSRVVFIPSKEMAAAVNAPFEMFETVELEESVLEEELMEAEAEGNELEAEDIQGRMIIEEEKIDELNEETRSLENVSTNETSVEQKTGASEKCQTPEENQTPEEEPASVGEQTREGQVQQEYPDNEEDAHVQGVDSSFSEVPTHAGEDEEDLLKDEHEDNEEEYEEPESAPVRQNRHKRAFGDGFIWGICAALVMMLAGIGILYWLNEDFANSIKKGLFSKDKGNIETPVISNPGKDTATVMENPAVEEAMAQGDVALEEESGEDAAEIEENAVPTQPSDKVVYDTITTTRYLTTMAKDHYGNYHLWPYIYKENEKWIGHPDRIRPGTKVVIPKLSKYGVDPKNPEDIAKAKKLGVEIYSRYK